MGPVKIIRFKLNMNDERKENTGETKFRELFPWIVVLVMLFAVPAVLVRFSMTDVPERSEIKVITVFQHAVDAIEGRFKLHAENDTNQARRLEPLPGDSTGWILTVNPMSRKAPGGGPAALPLADEKTGAIGIAGDANAVTITVPAYRGLDERQVILRASDFDQVNREDIN